MKSPKDYLIEILEYYIFKLKEDKCSMDEIESVTKAVEQNMEIHGTISDFAKFYDVPETTIRTNISRKMLDKPKRKVLYPFHKFAKIVPDKWRKPK